MEHDTIMARNSNFLVVNDVMRNFLQCKKEFKEGNISRAETSVLLKGLMSQLKQIIQDPFVNSFEVIEQIKSLNETIADFGKSLKDSEKWIGD